MSFGDGFANGLEYGSRVMQRGMDNYKERELEETQGKLFEAAISRQAKQLDEEGKVIEQKSQERENVMGMFSNASVGDIFQTTMDNYTANGGKINNDTYKLAMGVASTLFSMKEKEVEFQRENAMFGLKKEKLQAQISNYYDQIEKRVPGGRGGSGGGGGYTGKPTSFIKEYEWYKENYGQELADSYAERKAKGVPAKQKEPKKPTVKQIDQALDTAIELNPEIANLPKGDQWKAAKLFNSTGELPEVVVEESGGTFGLFKDKNYKLKGEPEAPAQPKKTDTETKKPSWKDYL